MARETTGHRLTVLVTAVGGGGVGEQTLKALRLAGGYRIVGSDVRPRCAQFALVDQAVILPGATSPEYLEALLRVCKRLDVQAIFPGSEPELRVMSDNRDRIEGAGLFLPINPARVIDIGMDKLATVEFLETNGFGSPRSVRMRGLDDLGQVDWFPVIVKPAVGSGGSRDCFIAQTPRQLELVAEYILTAGSQVMIQEYVGSPEDEYTVGVLHDMDGKFINSIGLRRLVKGQLHQRLSALNITGRRELGDMLVISSGVSHGYVDRFPEVTLPCERIAAALGARGAINVQCRLVDGNVQVFEINPRLSGTTSIRAMVGYNEPDILLRRHLLGEAIEERFSYRSAWVLRSLTEDIVSDREVPDWTTL
jgi:carbamoyl-phosphate synthase large subunit